VEILPALDDHDARLLALRLYGCSKAMQRAIDFALGCLRAGLTT
jgi:hypothetical protein